MRRRLFRAVFLTALAMLLLCGLLFSAALYNDYEAVFLQELRSESETIAAALNAGLDPADFLPRLKNTQAVAIRITWIAADGTVLYDSSVPAQQMENHAQRQEVAVALAQGRGEAQRQSETLSRVTYYRALRLADGSVLRLSSEQDSLLGLIFDVLRMLALVLLLAALVSGLVAARVSRRMLQPINTLDLEHPEQTRTFEELAPLLGRISAQNRQIAEQMAQLRRQQEEFATVTEQMSEGLLVVGRQRELLFCNASARRLLQVSDRDLGSCRLWERSAPLGQAVERALAGEHSLQTLSLSQRSWQLMANPVAVEGRTTGAVLVLLDVTEREDRDRLRREFSANVSHELRTPLTSIRGYGELIREGIARPEDVPKFADKICREGERLLQLIEDILRLSQLDEGGSGIERSSQRLDLIAGRVVDCLLDKARAAGVSLQLDSQACSVLGSERMLEELIFNLCDNAIKYNRPGGSVLLSIHVQEGRALLVVSDTGIGIPPAEQSRVFERFYRVDKSHSRAIGGTGLGLSIVKHAAAFHGAELSLSSALDKGTTIRLRFPPEA